MLVQKSQLADAFGLAHLISTVQACDTVLNLTFDVSISVDGNEYRLQIDRLTDALSAPKIAEAMAQGQIALASGLMTKSCLSAGWWMLSHMMRAVWPFRPAPCPAPFNCLTQAT